MTGNDIKAILDRLYQESEKAIEEGEIPVSCLLVLPDGREIITHNHVEKDDNPYHHAEFLALNEAMSLTKSRYLKGASLFVTLEPCLVCLGAILKAGVSDIYYVLDDSKGGGLSHHHVFVDNALRVTRLDDDRFEGQMKAFFKAMRKDNL